MNNLIKRYAVVFCISAGYIFWGNSFAQTGYLMSITNGTKINSKTIEFEVYIKSTSDSFVLTSYQCAITFSQFIINNGNLSFSYIPGTSDFLYLPPLSAVGLINEQGVYDMTFACMPPGQEVITSAQKRVGRFRLSNTYPFEGNSYILKWDFSGRLSTILTGQYYTNITNSLNHIDFLSGSTFQLNVTVQDGWNMLSVPGLHPVDQSINRWWINRDPLTNVFRFQGSYQSVTALEPRTGYVMKHAGNQVYNTGDEWPSEGFFLVDYTSVNVSAGWNIIGGYDYPVQVSGISTTPPGLQNGFIFGYTQSSGYQATNVIVPGYGYWISMTGNGMVNLPDPDFPPIPKIESYYDENWGKIIITDNAGKCNTLFAVNDDLDLDKYQLPPVPREGMFDVRFGSGRFAENLSKGINSIILTGVEYPVKVKIENINIRLQDESGSIINVWLNSGDETILTSDVNTLLIYSENIADNYILEQNYPNPFNPGTTIKFSLPEPAEVSLVIYDLLGQKITELVNSKLERGYYSYQWNTNNNSVSSGIYIYELKTNKFVSAKKMLMLK
jgi:hypothetical protein